MADQDQQNQNTDEQEPVYHDINQEEGGGETSKEEQQEGEVDEG